MKHFHTEYDVLKPTDVNYLLEQNAPKLRRILVSSYSVLICKIILVVVAVLTHKEAIIKHSLLAVII